jgi:hypothetical protein
MNRNEARGGMGERERTGKKTIIMAFCDLGRVSEVEGGRRCVKINY